MRWAIAFTILCLASPVVAYPVAPQSQIAQSDAVDGFSASCTGNLDGTGQCINQETSQGFNCVIIPGQVIDCKSLLSRPFQCVWISGVQANYAEFWCDPRVDAMLRSEISSKQFDSPPSSSSLGTGPSSTSFPVNELNSDRFSHDRFKPEDARPDDPFAPRAKPTVLDSGSTLPFDPSPPSKSTILDLS